MSKRIRPRRILADAASNTIIFEYISETLTNENELVSSGMKSLSIHVPNLDKSTDLDITAKRVMNKCKYIPDTWIDKVVCALEEVRNKNEMNSGQDISNANKKRKENIPEKLESLLEQLYGDDYEMQSALKEMLSICIETCNLELISANHALMAALSRILSDQGSRSRKTVFIVIKIFYAIADFEDFHQTLSKYRIGALIMSTIDMELRRADQLAEDTMNKGNPQKQTPNQNDNVLFVCFQILLRLSDSKHVMHKMLIKDLHSFLIRTLLGTCSKRCLDVTLSLMIRSTDYEEVVCDICIDDSVILQLIQLLIIVEDTNLAKKILCILFNLSFHYDNLTKMMDAGIMTTFAKANCNRDLMNSQLFGILYHLSAFQDLRESINEDILTFMLPQIVAPKEDTWNEIASFLINMSTVPHFVETMLPLIDNLVHQVLQNHNILAAKILRNISIWTRRLQIDIEMTLETADYTSINLTTRVPSKFVKHIEMECPDECPSYFNNYRSFKFWDSHIEKIASLCSTTNNDNLLLELLSILNHLTINDMSPSLSWTSISQKYDIIPLLRRCTMPGMSFGDINMEAVMLCNQICSHSEGASLLCNTKLISSLVQLYDVDDDDGSDLELLHQILCLCRSLICYRDSRNELLLKTDALRIIFECLNDDNMTIKMAAESCVDMIENYDRRDDDGKVGQFALMVRERRFMIYHNRWLTSIGH